MDDGQVAETAELILSEYPALKFDDIALFVRLCKLSHFGKLYDLNGAVLLQWLQTYKQERTQAGYTLYERRQREQAEEQARQEREEWESMPPEEQQAMQNRVNEIVGSIAKHTTTRHKPTN